MEELQRQGERNKCLNCGASIKPSDSFCANCGQKVDDNKLGLSKVISEFFENYISIDSRFGRSVFPFLFKPGYLAKEFMKGKRQSFANPFRLYIICSIFFFFGINSLINKSSTNKPIANIKATQLKPLKGVSTETQEDLQAKFDERTIKYFNNTDLDFKAAYLKMKPIYKKQLLISLDKKTLAELNILGDTSILDGNYSDRIKEGNSRKEAITIFGINQYKDSTQYTDEEVYKKVVGETELPLYQEIFYKRLIRTTRANEALLRKYIIGNLSLAMFALFPLFALVLKLFYFRTNRYYVAHLIHTFYLQAFAFLLFGFLFGLMVNVSALKSYAPLLTMIITVCFLIYFYKSLRKVYQESRIRTFSKGVGLLLAYLLLSIIVLMAEVVVSFLLF